MVFSFCFGHGILPLGEMVAPLLPLMKRQPCAGRGAWCSVMESNHVHEGAAGRSKLRLHLRGPSPPRSSGRRRNAVPSKGTCYATCCHSARQDLSRCIRIRATLVRLLLPSANTLTRFCATPSGASSKASTRYLSRPCIANKTWCSPQESNLPAGPDFGASPIREEHAGLSPAQRLASVSTGTL